MKTYKIEYAAAESRFRPGRSVDYMSVTVDADDEEYTLYAEIEVDGLADEHGNPAIIDDDWNPAVDSPETIAYPYLRTAIRELAEEIDLDPDIIDYQESCYEDHTYMMPYISADARII